MHLWVIAWLREIDAVTGSMIGFLVKVTGFCTERFAFERTGPIGEVYDEE